MNERTREIVISNATKEKVEGAKSFIEQRYSKLITQEQQKKEYWDQLNRKMQMLGMPANEQEQVKVKILREEAELLRQERIKLTIKDFPSVKIIGKGAFGEVRLCKWTKNGEPVAVKKLKKSEMIFKNKVVQSREERNVLAIS